MPIYEFYCKKCNRIFNFYSPKVDTQTVPSCPKCANPRLTRKPSKFSIGKKDKEDLPADENKIMEAVDSLLPELENAEDEENPAKIANLFRKFTKLSGIEPGPKMEEVLSKLEKGEIADDIEDALANEDLDLDSNEALEEWIKFKHKLLIKKKQPEVDEEIYFL